MKFDCVVERCYGYCKILFCYVFKDALSTLDCILMLFYMLDLIMYNFVDCIHFLAGLA